QALPSPAYWVVRSSRTTTSSRTATSIPAARFAPALGGPFGPLMTEGAGNAGCTPHPLPYAQNRENARRLNTGTPTSLRHSLRNGLRLLRALLGVPGLIAPVAN